MRRGSRLAKRSTFSLSSTVCTCQCHRLRKLLLLKEGRDKAVHTLAKLKFVKSFSLNSIDRVLVVSSLATFTAGRRSDLRRSPRNRGKFFVFFIRRTTSIARLYRDCLRAVLR